MDAMCTRIWWVRPVSRLSSRWGENGAVCEGAVMGYGALAGGKVDGALDEGAVEAGDRCVDGAGCSGFAEGEGLIRAVDFAGAHGLGENGGA